MANKYYKDIAEALKMVKETLSEQTPGVSLPTEETPARKPTKVNFDKNTVQPFSVVFSERGFSVEGTRMSFEELETAISKNYNITLSGGNGLILDAVKMQKILKYKTLY